MRIELKALDAHRRWTQGKPLPGEISEDFAETSNYDDIEEAIEHGVWDWGDGETDETFDPGDWEEVNLDSIPDR